MTSLFAFHPASGEARGAETNMFHALERQSLLANQMPSSVYLSASRLPLRRCLPSGSNWLKGILAKPNVPDVPAVHEVLYGAECGDWRLGGLQGSSAG